MHPEFMERMLAERVNDLRREAEAAHRAAQVRRGRHTRLAEARAAAARRAAVLREVAPETTPQTAPETAPEAASAEPVGAGSTGRRAA